MRCDKEILNFTFITQSELEETVNRIEGEERAIGDGQVAKYLSRLLIFQAKECFCLKLKNKQITNNKKNYMLEPSSPENLLPPMKRLASSKTCPQTHALDGAVN